MSKRERLIEIAIAFVFVVEVGIAAIVTIGRGRVGVHSELSSSSTIPFETSMALEEETQTTVEPTEAEIVTEIVTECESFELFDETQPIETENMYCDFRYYDKLPMSYETQYGIWEVGKQYYIDYVFLLAWAMQESGGNEKSASSSNGKDINQFGLYQIMPRWWDKKANELGLTEYKTNGVQNCALAVWILKKHLNAYGGDLSAALNTYRWNRVEPCVERDGRTYEEHINYWVDRISKM